MKKVLAIVLAIVMMFSMSSVAFAEDTTAEETTASSSIDVTAIFQTILDKVIEAVKTIDVDELTAKITAIVNQILESINSGASETEVLGAVADLEAKIGSSGIIGDVLEYVEGLVNNLKQKIKDLYAGNKETEAPSIEETEEEVVETTEAEAPVDTGSSFAGIAAFAAISVAAAAAFVCTKKKED